MSDSLPISQNWMFHRGDIPAAIQPTFQESGWECVNIPHTWNALDAQKGKGKRVAFLIPKFGGYHRGPGWYRHWETIPQEYTSKRIFLRFEGVCSVADIYVNGNWIAQHRGAFAAFCVDITNNVRFGERNLIVVRADNSPQKDVAPLSGDFPMFGGIYRPVYLLIKNPICISPLDYGSPGIYLRQTSVTNERAIVDVTVKCANLAGNQPKSISDPSLSMTLFDANGKAVLQRTKPVEFSDRSEIDIHDQLVVKNPHLWNGRMDPYLYHYEVKLTQNGQILDETTQPLGLRYYHIDPGRGFFLNGQPYYVHGVCQHQDRLNKGWAISIDNLEEDMQHLDELGVRGIRLAHYQHSDYIYTLCDQKGILVWTEIPLVNQVKHTRAFLENAQQQLRELIRQNFNHPCVAWWGMCNEVGLYELCDPSPVIKKLHNIAKIEDPTRYTVLAGVAQAAFRNKLNRSTDQLGLNAYPGWYYGVPTDMESYVQRFNASGNLRGLCVSEYGAGAAITHHEQNPKKVKPGSHWHPEEWQSYVHEESYRAIRSLPFVWGSFVWAMFDFAVAFRNEGDTPGRNDKGLVTYDRKTRKDAFFFYQANWTERPMAHITSRRHVERTDARTPVKVYSNCERVELFVNGKSLGAMRPKGFGIFLTEEVELIQGSNVIEVKASGKNQNIVDRCTWNLTKH